jgi:hypothetical protein
VFVSFYGVCEENNQQNTNFARLKKISWLVRALFKRERRGDSQRVIANRLTSQQLYEIEEKGKELSNVYSHGPCSHVWHNGLN